MDDEKRKEIIEDFVENSEGMKVNTPMVEFMTKYKNKKLSTSLDFVYCVLPGGIDGYRLELYVDDDKVELGTVVYSPVEKMWKLIQW